MSDYFIGQGDKPDFTRTLEDSNGDPVDIQGAAVHLTLVPIHGGAPVVDDDIANLQNGNGLGDGTRGLVGRAPAEWTETLPAGTLLGQITVTYIGGVRQTFPNDTGFLEFMVAATAVNQQRRYLSAAELKQTLNLEDESFANDDIEIAIEAASRGLEEAYGRFWSRGLTNTEQRYYTAETDLRVALGDVLEVTAVDIDYTVGDIYTSEDAFADDLVGGTYSTQLLASDYRLLPIQSGLITDGKNGEPYRSLQLARGGRYRRLPRGVDAIRITGRFGWDQVPAGVKNSVTIIATRLVRRAREAPYSIVAVGLEGQVVRAREIVRDPEVTFAMKPLTGARSLAV